MKPLRSNVFYGLVAVSFALGFGLKTFASSDMAQDGITIRPADAGPSYRMPTERDLTIYERQLRKATRGGRYAKTCGQGQLIANAAIHVAMHFPPLEVPATTKTPGFARAHVARQAGTPKALVLDSKHPTLWTVTGEPSVIVLTGKAVVANYPEGTPVFAPRFAEACGDALWAKLPRRWDFPRDQGAMSSMVDNVNSRFRGRADLVSQSLFGRGATGWEARRGDGVIAF